MINLRKYATTDVLHPKLKSWVGWALPVIKLRDEVKDKVDTLLLASDPVEAKKRKDIIAVMNAKKLHAIGDTILPNISSEVLKVIDRSLTVDHLHGGIKTILSDPDTSTPDGLARLELVCKSFPPYKAGGGTSPFEALFHDAPAGGALLGPFNRAKFFGIDETILREVAKFKNKKDIVRWGETIQNISHVGIIKLLPSVKPQVQADLGDTILYVSEPMLSMVIANPSIAKSIRALADKGVDLSLLQRKSGVLDRLLELDLATLRTFSLEFIESDWISKVRIDAAEKLLQKNPTIFGLIASQLGAESMRADRIDAFSDMDKRFLTATGFARINNISSPNITVVEIKAVKKYLTIDQFHAMGGWKTLDDEEFTEKQIKAISKIKSMEKIKKLAARDFEDLFTFWNKVQRIHAVGRAGRVKRGEEKAAAAAAKKKGPPITP